MEKYVSRFSAAIMWNIPHIEAVLDFEFKEAHKDHVTVAKNNGRLHTKEITNKRNIRYCRIPLPPGAVVMQREKKVASPELLFLELAGKLSIHRLILLGLQLCSHPPGLPDEAITTKQKLETFLAKTSGHQGFRKASRAIQYVESGSASIMESLAYMILALPHALGGYGLGGAVFNHEIRLRSEGKLRIGQNRCFADLYYKQARVAVEYESFTHHNSPAEQGKDAMRSAILERQGITVMHLSTIQLYNRDACRDFACNLSIRLGKRIQIRTKKFDEMHDLLRALLPAQKPGV
ncbi:MAG: hypothetical protein AAGU12_03590 [Clostridiales bacterium]